MKTRTFLIILAIFVYHLIAAQTLTGVQREPDHFIPGQIWPDNNGVHINAHGGGIIFHKGAYYWFGEHKIEGPAGNLALVGVHCYSSNDLYNWRDEGIALSVSDDPDSDMTKGCVLERPKVIYNKKTKKFVMWFHLELKGHGYKTARSGVAIAEDMTGPYEFIKSFRPNGQMARDMTLFVDDDGQAYHVYASEDNHTLHISLLAEDYLSPSGKYKRVFKGRYMEAPALCKRKGKYYFIGSGCTGWKPNAARSAVADSIWGPWKELGNPCVGINPENGLGKEKTFGCQSTFILPVQGKEEAFIAMFDMWRPRNAIDGRYVWLPIEFTGDARLPDGQGFKIKWRNEWDLSIFDKGNVTMSPARACVDFDFDWRFSRGDFPDAAAPGFDDSNWRKVNLPHDWSIEGPYDQNAPTGGAGGYLPTGVGWYRKRFTLPEAASDHIVWIEFDGIYENSTVWINGQHLGKRPFGYISFHYDLTPYLVDGENVIAVRVDNSNQPNTRWYSGSGIYRHVRLIITGLIHVGHWGVYVTTPEVSAESVTVSVRTPVENEDLAPAETAEVRSILIDPDGREIASIGTSFMIEPGQQTEIKQHIRIASPSLWSVETPVLYTLRTAVLNDGIPMDEVTTAVGVRKIEYDVDRGFLLNGKRVKMKGVNLHHDGGCVGAAVPERVWQRRLQILKAMGCNAIRTAHNPPAPEFLDLCDRMGFLVMDEAFDEWKTAKSQAPNMYHLYFDEWFEKDLKAMIHRDRNHPCVVMWSAGNEVREQPLEDGHEVLQSLIEIFHREDPTRPVTVGCDNIAADGGSTTPAFLELLDIVGYNYVDRWHKRRELYYSLDRHEHPDWKMVGTESVSIYSVRGGYSLGRDPNIIRPNYNTRMIRAEQLWKFVATRDYLIGDFMWTSIDYLGESRWPWKSSSSGVLDLCGFPKDSYYFYQSQWTDEPMIHILPHWNWPGRQGQVIPVLCYTNCDAVELFLNGKSFGEKRLEFPRQGNSGSWYRYEKPPIRPTTADLHLAWDVPYEPGVLKAVGKKNGQVVCTQQVHTAGVPAAIQLRTDRKSIIADAHDIAHVEVEIVDADGVFVPTADNLVRFTVEGQGDLIAVGNGNPADHDSFQADKRRAFNGLCLAIVQSMRQAGRIRLTARAEGLKEASVEIEVQPVTSPQSESVQTKRVVFEDSASEHKWALKELNPDLPRDWSSYEYLVMELRASSTQRFELRIHTTDGIRKVRIHPLQGAWIRACVPLKYFKRPESEGFDLASLGNKPRNAFWINLLGSYGSLNEVEALGVAMIEPIGEPTLKIRFMRLAKEDPGDAVLQAGPLVDEFGQWIATDWPGKVETLNELKQKWQQEQENLQPGDFNYCKYGGYLHTQAKATGFFRVEQIDGKWWFIDPDGHQFLSIGVDCVGAWMGTPTTGREDIFAALPPTELTRTRHRGRRFPYASFYTWNLQRRYGEDWDHKWMDMAIQRMDAWGLNTIANWSDPRLSDVKRKPYVATLGGWGMRTGYMGLPDVYSEEFAQRADEVAAKRCGPHKDDPWLLGYFVANEPPWPGRESLVVDMILQGEPTATQQKLKEFLAAGDTPERRKTFVHRAFEKSLEIINAAIRKHDPNHLNLGIRYGGVPPEEVIRMARVFDVYSQNVYKYVPEPQYLDKIYQLTGRPIIIGEFHFGTPGRGLAPGLRQTKNQQERSVAYRYYVENAFAHPAVIGTHWFQWIDQPATGRMDGENYNIGLIDVTDQPYPELVQALQATHKRLYDVHCGKVQPFNEKPKIR